MTESYFFCLLNYTDSQTIEIYFLLSKFKQIFRSKTLFCLRVNYFYYSLLLEGLHVTLILTYMISSNNCVNCQPVKEQAIEILV